MGRAFLSPGKCRDQDWEKGLKSLSGCSPMMVVVILGGATKVGREMTRLKWLGGEDIRILFPTDRYPTIFFVTIGVGD